MIEDVYSFKVVSHHANCKKYIGKFYVLRNTTAQFAWSNACRNATLLWCAKKLTTFCNLRGICYYNSKNDWLHATHSKTWFKISLKNLFEPNDSWNNWNNIWTNWIYLNQHLNTFLNWLNQYLIWLNLFESYKVRLREDICKLSVEWKTFFLN